MLTFGARKPGHDAMAGELPGDPAMADHDAGAQHRHRHDRLWFRIGPGPENDPARTGAGCGGLGGSGGGSDDDSAESAMRSAPFERLTKLLRQQKFIERRAQV